jgi:hypothetical protein
MIPLCLLKWCFRIDLRSVCKAGSRDSLHLLLPADSCAGVYAAILALHTQRRSPAAGGLELIVWS